MKHYRVTAAIIQKHSRYLIAKRKVGSHLAGHWEFPGGKIEEGETPEACLERELGEEFEIKVSIGDFLHETIYDYGEKVIHLMGYFTDYISGEFQLNDHDEIAWVSLEEFDQYLLAPADVPILEKLRELKATLSAASDDNGLRDI